MMNYIMVDRAASPRTKDWFLDDFSEDECDFEDEEVGHHFTDAVPLLRSQAFDSRDTVSSEGLSTDDDMSVFRESYLHDLAVLASPGDYTSMLYIAELVQKVFNNLSLYERVRCSGVCKTWRQLLRNETPTAFDMFLKPRLKAPFTPIVFPRSRRLIPCELENLTSKWHKSLNTTAQCQKELCVTLRPHFEVDEQFIHPLFRDEAMNEKTCLRINGHAASFLFIDTTSIMRFLELHQRSDKLASWRKMLLTNPPVMRFSAYSEFAGDVIFNEDGVKLGQVSAYLAEIVGRHDSRGGVWEGRTRREMIAQRLYEENRRLVG